MIYKKILLCSYLFLLVHGWGVAQQKPWVLDAANSKISFSVEHMSIAEIDGKFTNFSVDFTTKTDSIETAEIFVNIQSKSVNTGNLERDEHLRSHDFFYSEKFPNIIFKSDPNGFKKIDATHYSLSGKLTIKDITQPVVLDLKVSSVIRDLWGKERIGFRVKGVIWRELFGLTLNTILEQGILAIGKEVELKASIQLSR